MKSINYLVGAITTLFVVATCEKSNLPTENGGTSSFLETAKTSTKKWRLCCVWNGVDKCVKPKVNCFDEVIINGNQSFNELVTASDGTASSASTFFNSNKWQVIFPDFDVDEGEYADNINYLKKLQSGNYALIYDTKGDITYFFAGTPDSLTFDNFEFVIQVNTSEL